MNLLLLDHGLPCGRLAVGVGVLHGRVLRVGSWVGFVRGDLSCVGACSSASRNWTQCEECSLTVRCVLVVHCGE